MSVASLFETKTGKSLFTAGGALSQGKGSYQLFGVPALTMFTPQKQFASQFSSTPIMGVSDSGQTKVFTGGEILGAVNATIPGLTGVNKAIDPISLSEVLQPTRTLANPNPQPWYYNPVGDKPSGPSRANDHIKTEIPSAGGGGAAASGPNTNMDGDGYNKPNYGGERPAASTPALQSPILEDQEMQDAAVAAVKEKDTESSYIASLLTGDEEASGVLRKQTSALKRKQLLG